MPNGALTSNIGSYLAGLFRGGRKRSQAFVRTAIGSGRAVSAEFVAFNLDGGAAILRTDRASPNPQLQTNRVVQSCRPSNGQFHGTFVRQVISRLK